MMRGRGNDRNVIRTWRGASWLCPRLPACFWWSIEKELRNSGTQELRNAGTQELRNSGTQELRENFREFLSSFSNSGAVPGCTRRGGCFPALDGAGLEFHV